MNVEEAEVKITEALDEALAKGYTIVHDVWGSPARKCCCAMGAVALQMNGEEDLYKTIPSLYSIFGENSSNFWNIIYGFSQSEYITHFKEDINDPWFALGRKLKEKYKPVAGVYRSE